MHKSDIFCNFVVQKGEIKKPGFPPSRITDRAKLIKRFKVNKTFSVMKILVINETSTSRALGYYMALFGIIAAIITPRSPPQTIV